MYDQVLNICASHASVWNGTPAFVEVHTTFSDKLAQLKAQSAVQESAVQGVTDNKRAVLQKVVSLAIVASKALSALALKNGDTELLARNIYSRSEWFRGTALLRSARLTRLLEDVNAHSTVLEDYNIDSAFTAELLVQVNTYNSATQAPRLAILNRKRATAALDRLTTEIDLLLRGQLDAITEVFRASHPDFVEDFFNARIIVDVKGKRRGTNNETEEGYDY